MASPSPSSKPRWSARMGSMMRRTSTALTTISRPGSISERDGDSSSISGSTKGREASLLSTPPPPPPPPVAAVLTPGPISEPPLREAAAVTQKSTSASPLALPPTSPEATSPTAQSPTGYIPPPVIDSTAGNPGAFTDITDDLPQPDIVRDPHTVVTVEPQHDPQDEPQVEPPPAVDVIDSTAGNPGAFTDMVDNLPQPVIVQDPNTIVTAEPEVEHPSVDVIDSAAGNPGTFTDMTDELPQPTVAQDPYAAVPVEPKVEHPAVDVIDSAAGNPGTFTDMTDELPQPTVAQDPYAAVPVEPKVEHPAVDVIDSAAGNPGTFTDMTDELPQPTVAQDPYAVTPAKPHPEPPTIDAPEPAPVVLEGTHQQQLEPEGAITEVLVEEPTSYFDGPMTESIKDFEPVDNTVEPTTVDVPEPAATVIPETIHQHEPKPEATFSRALVEEPTGYFDRPIAESIKDFEPAVDNTIPKGAVNGNTTIIFPEPEHGEAAGYYRSEVIPTARSIHEGASQHGEEPKANHERQEEPTQQKDEPILSPFPVPTPEYNVPSYPVNLGSGQEVWGGEHDYYESASRSAVPVVVPIEKSPVPSIRMPEADPFADPIAPRITVSQPAIDMPHPQVSEEQYADGPVVMPLPSFYDVSSKPVHHTPSNSSLRDVDSGKYVRLVETDETLPLLSRPGSPNKHKPTSYLQTNTNSHSRNNVTVSPLVYSASHSTTSNGNANSRHPKPGSQPRLHSLGWLEYHLPDGAVYYVHPTNRVTTEINLRSEKLLTSVERFLDDWHGKDHSGTIEETLAAGAEIWLRDVGKGKSGMVLERWWVDHRLRTVVLVVDELENGQKGSGKGKAKKGSAVLIEEDQLDTEYRYWSFMEAHPAHNSLPAKAKTEALDVLTWAWTERILPSDRAVPAPFTQEECQELMALIRSFGAERQDDHGIQTRIVSRVLLRVAHWRQTYFRPNKPLPSNVVSSPSRLPTAPRKPFRRAIIDFVVSVLFLGIPYIFFERARFSSRIDEEGGFRNVATPTLVIGACTCLVAAIILSASVTFLSLPGLDAFSRTTGMVAIVFATFSMAATVVAIFRHKADLERPISYTGIEGIAVITRRTVVLSLPLVFLVYSIIAFIVAMVLYSFRGVALSDPSITKRSFEDYTRWGVVSLVGALAGIVTTSVLLLRR